MPSESNHSPGTTPMARAGFLPARNPENIDLSRLASPEETERLLLAAVASQQEQLQQVVVDDLADLDFDDPRFLVVVSSRAGLDQDPVRCLPTNTTPEASR